MSPNQRQNPDPYQDKRPPERQPRQGTNPPPTGTPQQGAPQGGGHQGHSPQGGGPQGGGPQGGGPQGGGPQGTPPGQFRGQQSPTPGGGQPQQQPQGVPRQPVQQPPQQAATPGGMTQPQQGQMPQQPTTGLQGGARGQQLRSAPIDEVLETDVVTVRADTSITEVAHHLGSEDVGSVVVTEDERPVGILTDRKIALALGDTADLSDRTAGDLVSRDLVTGTMEMTVFDVLRRLEDDAIRRLPIVDEEGNLEGIVTLDDVIVLLSAELSNVSSIIQGQSRRF